ncbi:hypothetical protein HZB60_03430 [candidate division KSB1 bacterium]|nr:hypothetical protein [candidate division KSB1 bacterium]
MLHLAFSMLAAIILVVTGSAAASPPAVGIIGNSRTCLACHADNGPWTAGPDLILDLIDKDTQQSLRQPDGSFLLTARRGTAVTALAVIGYRAAAAEQSPRRNGWIMLDTTAIGGASLSKFAPGWEINLPYGCRIVGDKLAAYPDAALTTAPITIRPTETAMNAEVSFQAMLTSGEAVKGQAKSGLLGNYMERTLHLRVSN